MKNNEITPYLVFSKTQAKIVSYLNEKDGGSSISEISKNIKLARTSIYSSIEELVKNSVLVKEKYIYSLVGHFKLDKKLDFDVQIRSLMKEILSLKKGEIVYSIESKEEIRELFQDKKWLQKWQETVAQKEIVLKGIGDISSLEEFLTNLDESIKTKIEKRSGSARFSKENIKGPCVLVSYLETTVFYSRKKKFFYRIDNKYIAIFIQSILESYYNQSEYIKIIK